MSEHVILVAITVEADTRERALTLVERFIPRTSEANYVEDWWVATDDRLDGSDRDSAVFVKAGLQADAHRYLEFAGMVSGPSMPGSGVNANDHSTGAQRLRDQIASWSPDVPDDTVLDLLMRVAEDVSREESSPPEDVERLQEMFSDE